jgi:GTP-binding protein EngB required for normal cell division
MKFFKKPPVINNLIEEKIYNIVALGNTGVGKSSLLNMLANSDIFQVGQTPFSQTQTTIHNNPALTFLGEPNEIKMILVDTQGIGDHSGDQEDNKHIIDMVGVIRQLEQIDLFLLCLEETNPKFSGSIQNTIKVFNEIFPDFFEHTVIIFNKATNPDMKMKTTLRTNYQKIICDNYRKENVPCYFIDSFYNKEMLRDNDDGTQSIRYLHPNIQERTRKQVNELKLFLAEKRCEKEKRCDVRNIKPKLTVLGELGEQLKCRIDEIERMKLEEKKREEEIKKKVKKNKFKKYGMIAGTSSGGTAAAIIIALIILL